MKKLEKALLTGCGYTVIILALFYLFAALTKFVSPAITTGQFFLILLFGMIISAIGLLCSLLNVSSILRCIIHYLVLLVAFCFIFIVSGNISSGKASAIFVAIVIYTVLYFVLWFTVTLIKKTVSLADAKLESKKGKKAAPKKEPYKPLYRED